VTREHGTYAGYQQHKRHEDEPCPECRAANAAYGRNYRRNHPEARANSAAQVGAYGRALARLRELHRDEFEQLYANERRQGGAS
jgi:hypothetical protein